MSCIEEKLARWIFRVVGASYVLLASVVLVILLMSGEKKFGDPLLIKSLAMLIVYLFSLSLIYASRTKTDPTKLGLWLWSLVIHVGINSYVLYIFKSAAAFAVMLTELIVLALMLVGIYVIWKRLRAFNT